MRGGSSGRDLATGVTGCPVKVSVEPTLVWITQTYVSSSFQSAAFHLYDVQPAFLYLAGGNGDSNRHQDRRQSRGAYGGSERADHTRRGGAVRVQDDR